MNYPKATFWLLVCVVVAKIVISAITALWAYIHLARPDQVFHF